MRIRNLVTILVLLSSCLGSSAGTSIHRNGTIVAVDTDNKTMSIRDNETGDIKQYIIPDKVNIPDEGVYRHDPSLLKPGQIVSLRFEVDDSGVPFEYIGQQDGKLSISGKVVSFDPSTGNGILRESRSKRIVRFRFADESNIMDMPRRGDMVDFTVTLEDYESEAIQQQDNIEFDEDITQNKSQTETNPMEERRVQEIEITKQMIDAGLDAFYERDKQGDSLQEIVKRIYRAMALEASR